MNFTGFLSSKLSEKVQRQKLVYNKKKVTEIKIKKRSMIIVGRRFK